MQIREMLGGYLFTGSKHITEEDIAREKAECDMLLAKMKEGKHANSNREIPNHK